MTRPALDPMPREFDSAPPTPCYRTRMIRTGAVNYVSVSDAVGMSGAALTAGLAADNLICALYFTSIYALARGIPAESASSSAGTAEPVPQGDEARGRVEVLPGSAVGPRPGCCRFVPGEVDRLSAIAFA